MIIAKGRVTVVRHSESTYNRDGLWAGWEDPGLTAAGREDAWYAAAHWYGKGVTSVMSSDLRRASQAAEIIAAALDVPLLPADARLRERHAGIWQGRPLSLVREDPQFLIWAEDQARDIPSGESWGVFVDRLHGSLVDVLEGSGDGHVLVVAHEGVVQALLRSLLGTSRSCRPLVEGVTAMLSEDGLCAVSEAEAGCVVCDIGASPAPEGHMLFVSEHCFVNSLRPGPDEQERPGWLVISPVRHVTRWHQLRQEEVSELARFARLLDAALTLHAGALRVMVASLGWETDAHLHVHVVPTFDPVVTEGYLNFDGRYSGVPHLQKELLEHVVRLLRGGSEGGS